jgi:UDP-glucuronate decarboxylase
LVEGMIRMMNSDDSFWEPVSIGEPTWIYDVRTGPSRNWINRLDSKIIHMPLPQDDPKQSGLIFHWLKRNYKDGSQKIQLRGLITTIGYFNNLLNLDK